MEFWNTLTGIFLIISSVLSINQNHSYPELNFNYLLILVGIGTILFHATLFYIWQLLDELPMILIGINIYNILFDLNITKYVYKRNNLNISIKRQYYICTSIIFSYFINTKL